MSNLTLGILHDYYLADLRLRNCTPDTVKAADRILKRFIRAMRFGEKMKPADLTPEDVEAYVAALQTRTRQYEDHPFKTPVDKPPSPFTIRREVKTLIAYGNRLKSEGFENPLDELALPKAPKKLIEILSQEDVQKILEVIRPHTESGARSYAIVMLMLDSGLRISEVAGARIPDLDLQRRQLKVFGKGQKQRIVTTHIGGVSI